jgi:hypothetical protein
VFLLLTSTVDHARPSVSVSTIQSVSIRQTNHGERSQMYVLSSAAAVTPCFNQVSTNSTTNSLLGNFQTGPEAHPTSYSVHTGVPSRTRMRPRGQVTHLHLVPTFGMNGAILLLPLYSLMAWTGKTLPYLSKYGLYENSSSGRRHHTCGRTDGRTFRN